ncbi:hypothetical protein E1N66_10385 [Pantoea allii]|nr:hypothetical protein [Pantoea allii]THB84431.1 hypothetical protein E1N66_10385 [Pantoea allii]
MKQQDIEKLDKNIDLINATIDRLKDDPNIDKSRYNELLNIRNRLYSTKEAIENKPEIEKEKTDSDYLNDFKKLSSDFDKIKDKHIHGELNDSEYSVEILQIQKGIDDIEKVVGIEKLVSFEKSITKEKENDFSLLNDEISQSVKSENKNEDAFYNEYKNIMDISNEIKRDFQQGNLNASNYESEMEILDTRMRMLSNFVSEDSFDLFEEKYKNEKVEENVIMFENESPSISNDPVLKIDSEVDNKVNTPEKIIKEEPEYILKKPIEVSDDESLDIKSDEAFRLLSQYELYQIFQKENIKEIIPGDMSRTIHMNDDSVITEKQDNVNFSFDKRTIDPLTAASRVISMAKQKEWETLTLSSTNPHVLATAYEMAVKEGIKVQPVSIEQEAVFKAIHAQKRLDQFAPFNSIEGPAEATKDSSLEAKEFKSPSKMHI